MADDQIISIHNYRLNIYRTTSNLHGYFKHEHFKVDLNKKSLVIFRLPLVWQRVLGNTRTGTLGLMLSDMGTYKNIPLHCMISTAVSATL